MSMRKSRKMHRSMGMNKRRSMRRSRMMRGGDIANQGTITGSSAGDPAATDVETSFISGEGPQVDGQYVPEFDPNKSELFSGTPTVTIAAILLIPNDSLSKVPEGDIFFLTAFT